MNDEKVRFKKALAEEKPLKIIGVPNAFSAMLAKSQGFKAIYLSGSQISGLNFGLPDLGLISFKEVFEEAQRILDISDLPLLVDIDTGFGGPLVAERTAKKLAAINVAAIHIEDQILEKMCGHLEGKKLISSNEMCEKIKAIRYGAATSDFYIIARTDSLNIEPFEKVIERCRQYMASGADMIFLEAARDLKTYREFKKALNVPLLANMTEFGKTPLYKTSELLAEGVDAVLYPLTLVRLMNQTLADGLKWLKDNESQEALVAKMQSRKDFYKIINYQDYETKSYLN